MKRSFSIFILLLSASMLEAQYYAQFRFKPAAGGGTPMSRCDEVDASNEDYEEGVDGGGTGSVGDIASSDLEIGNDGSTPQNVGMLFDGFTIPAGAQIDSAFVQFTVDNTSIVDPLVVEIYAEEGSNPAVFNTPDNNILSRDWTEAFVTWTLTGQSWTPVGNAGPNQRTPNLATIIQEAVDNPSYASGHNFVIIVHQTGSSGEREAESFDGDAAPEICIYWKE